MKIKHLFNLFMLLGALMCILNACGPNRANYVMPEPVSDSVPEIENSESYVTPEMYGAVGDGITDDTAALAYAFNSGKNVELISDYYTEGGFRCQANNITINGNGHALRTDGMELLHPVLMLDHAEDIFIHDLVIRSDHDRFPCDVGTHKPLSGQLSSNTYGLLIIDSHNITVENYSTYNIMYDTFSKRSENLTFHNWKSVNTLMGLYADDTVNYTASDFTIELDPVNTFSGCHAVYLCYGCDGIRFDDGTMIFESTTGMQNTPVFTMHTTNQIPDGKKISLSNVFIQGQWPIQISNTSDPVRFENCTFDTEYPNDAIQTLNNGQMSVQCDADFLNCNMRLNSFDYGFINGNYDITINLKNCMINDKSLDPEDTGAHRDTNGRELFIGKNLKVELDNTTINWANYVEN